MDMAKQLSVWGWRCMYLFHPHTHLPNLLMKAVYISQTAILLYLSHIKCITDTPTSHVCVYVWVLALNNDSRTCWQRCILWSVKQHWLILWEICPCCDLLMTGDTCKHPHTHTHTKDHLTSITKFYYSWFVWGALQQPPVLLVFIDCEAFAQFFGLWGASCFIT